jgi:hypothetical protein
LLWTPYANIINDSKWFCIAEDSTVLMDDGTVTPIQDVSAGDYVRTYESPSKRVLNRFDNGVQECFEVTLANGLTIVATADHEFHCIDSAGVKVWKKLRDINNDDEVITS